MSLTFRACLAFRNLADVGVITASSAYASMPAAMLQDPHVARKWRGRAGGAEFILVDLGTATTFDTVMLAGLNLSAAGSARVRVSVADPSGQAGEAYDTGVPVGSVDPAYAMLVHLIPDPVTGRYVRIDLADPGSAYIEAGRLFVGPRAQFSVNFAYNWNRAWVDRSRRTESRGGQTIIDPDNSYRTVEINFERVTAAERYGFVEEIDRVNGMRTDVLLVDDPTCTNLGRASIWGLMSELSAVSQPYFDNYSKSYKIAERL